MTYLEWETKVYEDFPQNMVAEVEAFLAKESERDYYGPFICEGVYQSNLFFPLQRRQEMAKMLQIAEKVGPRVVMEIGCDKGGSLYHWCKLRPKTVIACEIRGIPYQAAFNKAFPNIDFAWWERSSYPAPTLLVDRSGSPTIDVLFIDGDKTGMYEDFMAYLPLMSPKGVVFLHDIKDDKGPREAFEKIKGRGFRTEEIIDVTESTEALARGVAGLPPANPHEAWLRHWKGMSCGVGVVYLEKK